VKKRAKKGLNKIFVTSTKVRENRGEQVSKTNQPAMHLD
jgi:hypothetical protein